MCFRILVGMGSHSHDLIDFFCITKTTSTSLRVSKEHSRGRFIMSIRLFIHFAQVTWWSSSERSRELFLEFRVWSRWRYRITFTFLWCYLPNCVNVCCHAYLPRPDNVWILFFHKRPWDRFFGVAFSTDNPACIYATLTSGFSIAFPLFPMFFWGDPCYFFRFITPFASEGNACLADEHVQRWMLSRLRQCHVNDISFKVTHKSITIKVLEHPWRHYPWRQITLFNFGTTLYHTVRRILMHSADTMRSPTHRLV